MKRLFWSLLGWGLFVYDRVSIFQKRCLVDQTVISEVLDLTKSKRTWCEDRRLSIFVEPYPFKGIYGVNQTVEVARFEGGFLRPRSANIRITAESVKVSVLVDLIGELNRVNPK